MTFDQIVLHERGPGSDYVIEVIDVTSDKMCQTIGHRLFVYIF